MLGSSFLTRTGSRRNEFWGWEFSSQTDLEPGRLIDALEQCCSKDPIRVLREHPTRRCAIHPVAQEAFGSEFLVLKQFRISGPLARLKRVFGFSPASREWRHAQTLLQRSIPHVPWLARREIRDGNDWIQTLVAPFFENAPSLDHWTSLDSAQKRVLARRVGALVATFHRAGFVHRDLHAANILVAPDQTPVFIDFQSLRLSQSSTRQRKDLMSLGRFFLLRGSRTDRWRFLRAYLRTYSRTPSSKFEAKAWVRKHWPSMLRDTLQFLNKRQRRPLRPGGPFKVIERQGKRGISITSFDEAQLDSPSTEIHQSSRSRVLRLQGDLGAPELCLKVYDESKGQEAFKRRFRPSKGRRSWLAYAALNLRDLPIPSPLLYLEDAKESWILTEFVSDAQFLAPALQREDSKPLWQRIARDLRRMHDLGLRHRDLKSENILVFRPEGESSTIGYRLVDTDGVSSSSPRSLRNRAHDLARLHMGVPLAQSPSLKDRLRFLKLYVRCGLTGPLPQRQLRDLIVQRSKAIQERWSRQGR